MSQASLIINVSNQEQVHSNGLSGTWTVLGKKAGEEFSFLVVYPTPEIQDIGDGRRVMHWLKARPLALDIVGMRSDAASHGVGSSGTKEKWGLLVCEAEPDLPKELLAAIEDEIQFLNDNPPDVKMRKDAKSGAIVAVNIEEASIKDKKIELSDRIVELRAKFVAESRKLVTRAEIARAKKNLLIEDQLMVAQGDRMWAREKERENINENHRQSCIRLGLEKPWCYVPMQLIDCPGCGTKIKENILSCPSCGGWLDEGVKELSEMSPKARKVKMYPNQDAEAVATGGKKI